ncbi:MAG: hypothetical protein K0R93_3168, partial [Anaerosolibacter sp.]|nr:hypothetical protein [Anaerosolibacter sp.]
GEAMGFFVRVCISAPDRLKLAPIKRAVSALGILEVFMIMWAVLSE